MEGAESSRAHILVGLTVLSWPWEGGVPFRAAWGAFHTPVSSSVSELAYEDLKFIITRFCPRLPIDTIPLMGTNKIFFVFSLNPDNFIFLMISKLNFLEQF